MRPPWGDPASIARALLGAALGVRRGEHLVVHTWSHTLPWAAAAVEEARARGADALLLLEDEATFWRSVERAPPPRPRRGLPPPVRAAVAHADALLVFPGPEDRPRLAGRPDARVVPFLARDDDWLALARRHRVRGLRCLLGYAGDAAAERWGVPAALWRSRLIRGIVNADLAAIGRDAGRASRLLARGRELTVRAANGTDLTVRLAGRRPWVDDGRVDAADLRGGPALATAPAGSIVVAVQEGSARGTVVADRPSFLTAGRVDGAQWEIDRGRLRNFWPGDGGEAFEREFAAAPAGRDVVGLFALGLNPALPPAVPHAEDLEAGTVTIAIGGNALYGGRNRCSYLSWITVGGASVAVDGTPLCDRGKIL